MGWGRPGRIGQRLLGLGKVLFRWRVQGKTTVVQFEPLQRRLHQARQAGVEEIVRKCTANACVTSCGDGLKNGTNPLAPR